MDVGAAQSADIWTWQGWGAVGGIAGLAALVVSILGLMLPGWRQRLEELLDDPVNRAEIKQALAAKTPFEHYQARIRRLNRRIGSFFGPADRYRAFERCLAIALVYPIFLFLIAWLFGGAGELAGYRLLPEIADPIGRLWRVLMSVVGAIIVLLVFLNLDRIAAHI